MLREALGYDATEVNGLRVEDILTVGSRIFFQTHFYPLIKLHGKASELYLSMRTRSNVEIPVLLNAMLSGDKTEFIIQCAGMQISQRNSYEKEILRARNLAENALLENRELLITKQQLESNQEDLETKLKELSAKNSEHEQVNNVLSHDLQEPLRKISMFSNKILTQDTGSLDENTRNVLDRIYAASAQMRDLVLSLQKYMSLRPKHLSLSKVELAAVLGTAVGLSNAKGLDKLRLEVTTPDSMYADYFLLASLFSELLNNAVKFRDTTKEELIIRVTSDVVEQNMYTQLEGRYRYMEMVRVKMTDNGTGFDNKYASEIFMLFRRAHIDTDGIGLGLAYCKKIMDMHHGSITAHSVLGKGTTFTLLFPASQAPWLSETPGSAGGTLEAHQA